ncbi:E3 ubiquitin-protein ligase E3D isoform X1 [Colossoma macropomum]|uniref:E3 ubiquitin-protein ligase E3D isoform X1 n=1 Tax=Colossoma macropomum TaxID=42526 RepID=UPI0018651795|nr:E3 ubiquitin-protein ligase E3D isoform X1 [Colossoma macropomum]
MEVMEKQHFIFLELRQRLQSGLLVIRSDAVEDRAEINVSSGDSALKIRAPDGEYQVKLTPGVSLVEGSCQKSAEVNDDELHIRLRLKVDQYSEASDSVIERLRAQEKYCFLCQSCGAMLLKDRVFRRVLPLPNGNWNALVDDWCCHPDPFANKKLLPQEEDCLLGDTYFLLTQDSSCDQSLAQEVDLSNVNPGSNQHSGKPPGHRNVGVFCKKCSAVLGEAVTTEVVKFYITQVVVTQSDGQSMIAQPRQEFLERALASRLFELSSAQSIFRFSIQTPGGKAMIMIWLLNTDTLIASFSEKARSSDSLISSSDRHLDEHQSCQAVCASKVLYLPCTHSKYQDAYRTWTQVFQDHTQTPTLLLTPTAPTQKYSLILSGAAPQVIPVTQRCLSDPKRTGGCARGTPLSI